MKKLLFILILVNVIGCAADLVDLHLAQYHKVQMDDVFYGHCEGEITDYFVDANGVRHYIAEMQCRSVNLRFDWTVYVLRGQMK